jgi:hypothetical protein
VAAQRHLDARLERLRAYAAALDAAVAARPPDARLAQLERQLAQARRALLAAARPRLPEPGGRAGAAPAAGTDGAQR